MEAAYLKFTSLFHEDGAKAPETLATLVLNRPDAANAFSGELLLRITTLLREVARRPEVRLLLLQGAGKHFSAGADLQWMQAAARLDYAGNIAEAEKLTAMFETLAQLPIPTVALVKGAVYGGAVGLVAACDYAMAIDSSRFSLSETKIGLLPAVILPYLARKIPAGHLHRQVLTARVFSAAEAQTMGLIQTLLKEEEAEARLQEEVLALLLASPEAQKSYKTLFQDLSQKSWRQGPRTAEAIARARASAMGQAGLAAFFQKKSSPWVRCLASAERLLV